MKYILTQTNQNILGPFTTVESTDQGYLCDNSLYPTIIYGQVTLSEVPDNYMTPDQIVTYNTNQSELRAKAYPVESDPIFFQWQRGLKTEQEWLDAVAKVHAQYPYIPSA
jgi:hypothetical protein